MPLVSYRKRCATKIMNEPCPICGKRQLMQESKLVEKDGKLVWICKVHLAEDVIVP